MSLAKTYNPDVLSCLANLSNDEVFTPPEFANRMLDTLAATWAANNGGAGTTIDEYTSLGNGLYFFKQLASVTGSTTNHVIDEYKRNMIFIAKTLKINDVSKLPNQFDYVNYLPQSMAFNGGSITGGTKNFNFNTDYSFNPLEFGPNNTSQETTANNLVTRTNNGTPTAPAENIYNAGKYEMQYVYEKINYDFIFCENHNHRSIISPPPLKVINWSSTINLKKASARIGLGI